MYYNRFQQGDEVQYAGKKESLAKIVSGKQGTVVARVGCSESEVVVDFGGNAYIVDETTDLARFVKRERPAHETESNAGPEVTKRRGVGEKPAPGKRGPRRGNQEAT